jgi:hypothetical protein
MHPTSPGAYVPAADAVAPGAGRAAHRRRHWGQMHTWWQGTGNVRANSIKLSHPAAGLGVWLWNRRRAEIGVVLVPA